MRKILVTGIGTGVGKTLVSAILTQALDADYWKPIQCGMPRDTDFVSRLTGKKTKTHPEAILLKLPRSPHHAAQKEGIKIDTTHICLPETSRPLIIEGCGGIFVPLNLQEHMTDLFMRLECEWIIVSRHYLGSINHTLLTLEALKMRGLAVRGIIFNGRPCKKTEDAILSFSSFPCIARLTQETRWNQKRIHQYAMKWKSEQAFQSAMLN